MEQLVPVLDAFGITLSEMNPELSAKCAIISSGVFFSMLNDETSKDHLQYCSTYITAAIFVRHSYQPFIIQLYILPKCNLSSEMQIK